jgi:hypothetical protein
LEETNYDFFYGFELEMFISVRRHPQSKLISDCADVNSINTRWGLDDAAGPAVGDSAGGEDHQKKRLGTTLMKTDFDLC